MYFESAICDVGPSYFCNRNPHTYKYYLYVETGPDAFIRQNAYQLTLLYKFTPKKLFYGKNSLITPL